jgi:hypothetical protein
MKRVLLAAAILIISSVTLFAGNEIDVNETLTATTGRNGTALSQGNGALCDVTIGGVYEGLFTWNEATGRYESIDHMKSIKFDTDGGNVGRYQYVEGSTIVSAGTCSPT